VSDVGRFIDEWNRRDLRSKLGDAIEGFVREGQSLELILAMIGTAERGSTGLEIVVDSLAAAELAVAVTAAVDHLMTSSEPVEDDPARIVVERASQQGPELLHSYLPALWDLGVIVDVGAWRNAPDTEIDRLVSVIDAAPESALAGTAWLALLETRTARGWQSATDRIAIVPAWDWETSPPYQPVDQWYHYVGFDLEGDVPTRLCGDDVFHLLFEPSYVGRDPGSWAGRWLQHPTWFDIGPATQEASFGGALSETCGVCGEALHHMITLDPVPAGLVVQSRSRMVFATCLSCLGYVEPVLYFAHDARGVPTPIGYDGPRRSAPPRFR